MRLGLVGADTDELVAQLLARPEGARDRRARDARVHGRAARVLGARRRTAATRSALWAAYYLIVGPIASRHRPGHAPAARARSIIASSIKSVTLHLFDAPVTPWGQSVYDMPSSTASITSLAIQIALAIAIVLWRLDARAALRRRRRDVTDVVDRRDRVQQVVRPRARRLRRHVDAARRHRRPARPQRRRQVDADQADGGPPRGRRAARSRCSARTRSRTSTVRRRIGYAPEHEKTWDELTALELVTAMAELAGVPRERAGKAAEDALAEMGMTDGDGPPGQGLLEGHAPAHQARDRDRARPRASCCSTSR